MTQKYKFKYIIKRERCLFFPYIIIVELKDDSFIYRLDVSQTLWGAKRKIKKLKDDLIHELSKSNIIKEGEIL